MAKACLKSPVNGANNLIAFQFPAVNGWASEKIISTFEINEKLPTAAADCRLFF
jgi:hypothetical protein